MRAYKCDRCGKLYESYDFAANDFHIVQTRRDGTAWDLCLDCHIELQEWMIKIRYPKCKINGLRCEYCTKRNECTEEMAVNYRKEADNNDT